VARAPAHQVDAPMNLHEIISPYAVSDLRGHGTLVTRI